MTDYWASIQERLHEESGLHYPFNTMGIILQSYFNGILNKFSEDDREMVDQGFLITASGLYLDKFGQEMGLPRKEGTYATGTITFTLTRKIPKEETPVEVPKEEVNGVTFDFVPETVEELINQLNEELEEDETVDTILEIREASSLIEIPRGILLKSDDGFQYVLQERLTIPKGTSIVTGRIKALESGERYNNDRNTIHEVNEIKLSSDIIITNKDKILGGTDGETDAEYRKRLLNHISTNISVNYLKRQGIIVYTKKELDDMIRIKMTSFNPYLNNKYCVIPPNEEISNFVNYELIGDYCLVSYIKGW